MVKEKKGRKNKCKKCGLIFFDKNYSKRSFCSLLCYWDSYQFKQMIRLNGLKCKGRKITWADKISSSKINKPRLNMRGKNHPNWKGGFNSKKRRWLMGGLEYRMWRNSVFKRDNYTCRICGDRNGYGKTINLVAHHVVKWSENEGLRYSVDNGFTVCKEDHILGHQIFA